MFEVRIFRFNFLKKNGKYFLPYLFSLLSQTNHLSIIPRFQRYNPQLINVSIHKPWTEFLLNQFHESVTCKVFKKINFLPFLKWNKSRHCAASKYIDIDLSLYFLKINFSDNFEVQLGEPRRSES